MKQLLIGFILVLTTSTFAQTYKTHTVAQGDNLESIAQKYKVTSFDIEALNPDVKNKLTLNTVLIIPKTRLQDTLVKQEKKLLSYSGHKVKRKETLFSISQKYDIEVEDIKKHNRRLYSEVLRKGDRIKIPKFQITTVQPKLVNTLKKYKVKKSEGKWRVAYKFGISVLELETLNPNIGNNLQLNQNLVVPNIDEKDEREIDDNYDYYTVQPAEGFLEIHRKTGFKRETLESLNTGLKESGLKLGMVLKTPKKNAITTANTNYETINLVNKIRNYTTKNIAIMLPLRLHKLNIDSTKALKNMLKKDGGALNISLDFYSGVLMALDSAKQLGLSTKLDVYDTYPLTGNITSILNNNDFLNYDAVIGPLIADNFELVASRLEPNNVPLISTVKTLKNNNHNNVFQTQPQDELLRNTMIDYVKNIDTISNLIILSDFKSMAKSNALKSKFAKAKQIFARTNENEEAYILPADLEEHFTPGRNIVFLETISQDFANNIASVLSPFIDEDLGVEIILMTTNKNTAFNSDNIHKNLAKLKFHYPSVHKPHDTDMVNNFISSYTRQYNTPPNRYAIRGFDLTMDIILRLAYTDSSLFETLQIDMETEYVENKFRYIKSPLGGYRNEAAYIVKYDGLKVVESQKL